MHFCIRGIARKPETGYSRSGFLRAQGTRGRQAMIRKEEKLKDLMAEAANGLIGV